jgi:hypothetical protein
MAPDLMATGSETPAEAGAAVTQRSGWQKLKQKLQVQNPLSVEGHAYYVEADPLWINEGKLTASKATAVD